MLTRKTCSACRQRLSPEAFNASARSADGLAGTCRACTNARRRQRERPGKGRQPADRVTAALRRGDIEAVRERVRGGATPHWGGVCEAMRGGHFALAESLLESGAESNVFTAAAVGDTAGLKRRLRRAPAQARLAAPIEPDCRDMTPLHVGCASDHRPHGPERMAAQVEVAEALWGHGADVNAPACYRGMEGATPLFCACWSSGNLALVRWLLDRGAVAADRDLLAALGHFQHHGRGSHDIAEALLDRGVRVDGAPGDRTPLQAFAHQGDHRTVAWLIAHGADVNARGPGGRTAAHFAAERNTAPTTLALLVENGADLAARDEDGHTPLDTAERNAKARLVGWIKGRVGGGR